MSCSEVTASMQGKVCVVTGANAGIGKAAAEAIAALGAHVVLVCRNKEKGARALADVTAAAARSGRGGSAELRIADLSSQAEVRRVAAEVVASHPVIDVLVNNAGLALKQRELTVDGIERTFAVNYLAYFMLANLLLPALRAAASARIVNVSSEAHAGCEARVRQPAGRAALQEHRDVRCEQARRRDVHVCARAQARRQSRDGERAASQALWPRRSGVRFRF